MRRAVSLLSLLGLALLVPAAPVTARWSASAGGAASVVAVTMVNATGLTAACTAKSNKSSVSLGWTISPSLFVSGYEVVRTGAGGGTSATLQVAGRATSSYTDKPPNTAGSSYTYSIRATSSSVSWTTSRLAGTGEPTYARGSCTTS